MNTQIKILLALVAWFGVLTMMATPPLDQGIKTAFATQKGITVRLLLFSGRTDPVYALEDQQTLDKIKASLDQARQAREFDQATVIPSILGYKGILVENPEKLHGLPVGLAVYRGTIEVIDEPKRFLVDEAGALEEMLINAALQRGVIDKEVLERIRKKE